MISIFQLFQEQLHMEDIFLSWCDILELVAPIMISLIKVSANKEAKRFLVTKLNSSPRKFYSRLQMFVIITIRSFPHS